MKHKLFLILVAYFFISLRINVFFYGKSHLYVARLQQDIIDQVPEHFYTNSWSIFDVFHEMKDATPSEIQEHVSSLISLVALMIKNTCEAYNDPDYNQYLSSCNFSGSCSLHETFEKMFANELTREKYITEIQEIFENHFDSWNFFLLPNRADQEEISQIERFAHWKAEIQENRFKKLQIESSENELTKEMKTFFNIFLDFIEAYDDCLEHFSYFLKEDLKIEVDQLLNGFKPIEIRLRGIDSKGGISVSLAFQQLLHHLYLYLCLNHHQMIYINSIVAVFSAFWFYQICIAIIFCIFPILPLWIILIFELTGHYIYKKIFGKIRGRPPILTALLTTTRTQHIPKIPKFDTMRMYKRRKKKSTK